MEQKIEILYEERRTVIKINGFIGLMGDEKFDFEKVFKEIRNVPDKKVDVEIRSTGGDLRVAFDLYAVLKDLRFKRGIFVSTWGYGYIASAATIVSQAATKGFRRISMNSLYLIHNPAPEIGATRKAIKLAEKLRSAMAELYTLKSGMPKEIFLGLMAENNGNGRWLSPKEVIAYGLADVQFNPNPYV